MLKKYISAFLLLLISTTTLLFAANDPIPPVSQKLVNNYSTTGFLTDGEVATLENKLEKFANETSNQIVIVIIDDLGGMEPVQFATKLGNQWKVGQEKMNNGIIILIKPSGGPGERKYFISAGKGLEGAIPDATCRQIEQNELLPNLKSGNSFIALDKATDVLMALAKGEYNSDQYGEQHSKDKFPKALIIPLIFLILIIILRSSRGGRGGGGLGMGSGFFLGSMFGGGGSGFGGGGSSGGFGGFGGGGFGGGGSGGSW